MQNTNTSFISEQQLEPEFFYKGKGQISNGRFTVVNLSNNIDKNLTDVNLQVFPIFSTQHSDHIMVDLNEQNSSNINASPLYPSEIRNNSFVVYGPNCYFYWIITGKYKGLNYMISNSNSVPKKVVSAFRDRFERDD